MPWRETDASRRIISTARRSMPWYVDPFACLTFGPAAAIPTKWRSQGFGGVPKLRNFALHSVICRGEIDRSHRQRPLARPDAMYAWHLRCGRRSGALP